MHWAQILVDGSIANLGASTMSFLMCHLRGEIPRSVIIWHTASIGAVGGLIGNVICGKN